MEEFYSKEIPKEELRRGVVYKKVYSSVPIKQKKKFGDAPAHLKVLPHLEWNDNKP